jgi:hypothetical protein
MRHESRRPELSIISYIKSGNTSYYISVSHKNGHEGKIHQLTGSRKNLLLHSTISAKISTELVRTASFMA